MFLLRLPTVPVWGVPDGDGLHVRFQTPSPRPRRVVVSPNLGVDPESPVRGMGIGRTRGVGDHGVRVGGPRRIAGRRERTEE